MSGLADILGGQDNLQGILAQLHALLTPTEQLPGQQAPSNLLLAMPQAIAPQTGAPAVQQQARPQSVGMSQAAPSPSGSSGGLSSLLKNPSLIKSAIGSLLGPSLASYGSGAAANSAVASALGSVASQTAPTASAIQAANDAALAATDGGAAGAGAGLLSTGALGSGLAADAAVTGELGSVGAQTAAEAAAIQAANDAALGGSGSAAGGAGLGSAAGAIGLAALPLILAATVPQQNGLTGSDVSGMEQQIANATKANGGPINAGYAMNPDGSINQANSKTLTALATLQGDDPTEFSNPGGLGSVAQFLAGLGYPTGHPGPITTLAPGGKGWLGGGARGASRV